MTFTLTEFQSHRSIQEIEIEIWRLRKISEYLPAMNRSGFDNQTAIRAAITVLKAFQTSEEVSELYTKDSAHTYTIDAALDAAEWLNNRDVAPSCFWLEECRQTLRGQNICFDHSPSATPSPFA